MCLKMRANSRGRGMVWTIFILKGMAEVKQDRTPIIILAGNSFNHYLILLFLNLLTLSVSVPTAHQGVWFSSLSFILELDTLLTHPQG